MSVIQLLNGEERQQLKHVFDELNTPVPQEPKAYVVAVTEDGKINACVTAETILKVDMWWVTPEHRNTHRAANYIKSLHRYLEENIPSGTSVIAVADSDKHRKIFKRIGMRPIEECWQKDLW